MAGMEKNYEIDYAYLKSGTSEFGSVHITLAIGNDDLTLFIESNELIEAVDLEGLLLGLQNNQFKRMRLNIKDDCRCIFSCQGLNYLVQMDNSSENLKVLSLNPVKE